MFVNFNQLKQLFYFTDYHNLYNLSHFFKPNLYFDQI
jgi:hypothetical protein